MCEAGLNLSPNLLGVKSGQGARLTPAATPCTIHSRGQVVSRQLRQEFLAKIQGLGLRHTWLCLPGRQEGALPAGMVAAYPSIPE